MYFSCVFTIGKQGGDFNLLLPLSPSVQVINAHNKRTFIHNHHDQVL